MRDLIDEAIAQWAEAFPSVDVSPIAVFGRVRLIARIIQLRSDELLNAHGITRSDFDIISLLARVGRPLTPSEIASMTFTSPPATTKRIQKLVNARLVARKDNPDDGRGALVSLAGDAQSLLEPVLRSLRAVEQEILDTLGDGQEALIDGLRLILLALDGTAFGEDSHPGPADGEK